MPTRFPCMCAVIVRQMGSLPKQIESETESPYSTSADSMPLCTVTAPANRRCEKTPAFGPSGELFFFFFSPPLLCSIHGPFLSARLSVQSGVNRGGESRGTLLAGEYYPPPFQKEASFMFFRFLSSVIGTARFQSCSCVPVAGSCISHQAQCLINARQSPAAQCGGVSAGPPETSAHHFPASLLPLRF